MARDVIGRDDELAAIAAFLEQTESGPGALVLSGEPGIGKTLLWERGVEVAESRFARILTCRAIEAEATLSFTGLSELLGPVLDEVPVLLPPRRRALEVALLIAEPGDHPPDALAIGLAVLDVLRGLSAEGPVLVALDDAQWLDPASAAALQLALRRLRSEPIGSWRRCGSRRSSPPRSTSTASCRKIGWCGSRSAHSAPAPCTGCSSGGSASS
jgi:predicted ATPase